MKLYSSILILFFSLFSLNSYANSNVETVAVASKKSNKSLVIVTGTIVKAIDKDEFIIQDTTGKIKIEIDLLSKEEKINFFKQYPTLLGASVVIEGILNKEAFETTKIKVKRIEVVGAPMKDPFSDALGGDLSVVQSISVAKGLNDKSQVLLYGIVYQLLDDDEFILRDKEGSDIKVELDFHSKGEEIAFISRYGKNLVGATVLVDGFLDKEFMEKIKVDASRIQVITRSNNDPFADAVNRAKSINN